MADDRSAFARARDGYREAAGLGPWRSQVFSREEKLELRQPPAIAAKSWAPWFVRQVQERRMGPRYLLISADPPTYVRTPQISVDL